METLPTLKKMLSELKPGDTLTLRAGTYTATEEGLLWKLVSENEIEDIEEEKEADEKRSQGIILGSSQLTYNIIENCTVHDSADED